MRKFLLISCFVFLVSCSKEKAIELHNLNGYWEIKKVEMTDGSSKEYNVNPIIDFYVVKDSVGSKTKLQPQFDGKFVKVSGDEKFSIRSKNGVVSIHFETPYEKYEEEIIELSDSILSTKNLQQIIYHYKRYVPINL